MPSGATVEVRGVWKTFAAGYALRDVWLAATPGRLLAVLGPNGAGKSTLLRAIAGITRATRGEVLVAGRVPQTHPDVRRLIGFAGHASFLYGHLSAEENLQFYADLYGLPSASVGAALDRFGLQPYRQQAVRTLSRGLLQRVSLARTVLHDPLVLLLDEPFTGLDAAWAQAFRTLLEEYRGRERTVIMATHAWADAQELADDVVVLVGGRLAASDSPRGFDVARLVEIYQQG